MVEPSRRGGMLLTGTRLVREWKGAKHEMTVIEDGFEYWRSPSTSRTPFSFLRRNRANSDPQTQYRQLPFDRPHSVMPA